MSKTVDERIVQMRFDNADFEKNINQSMQTLTKFDSALNSSLDGNRFNLSKIADVSSSLGEIIGIGTAVENVGTKFSALQTIGVGALLKIGEQATVLAEKLVKDLTLDQVTAGFTKYADKTTSVQTIMAATADEFENQGEQMEYVSAQLEKLNWFTDETSYNFVDMTNNIGKFTSQGIKLEDSVTAMEGISVWAAQSGQNAEAASRAMYNLSQALGAGAVKLQDWKSIENANMATKEFKEIAIAAGEAAGTIEKGQVTIENFSQSLGDKDTKGWFSSEVLMDVLKQYGSFTDVLNDVCNSFEEADVTATDMLATLDDYMNGTLDVNETAKEYGTTVEDLTEKLDRLGASEYDLGRKSFKSAQEAKTFEEAIDATKDAVSTAWLNIFETIFGNYLEAKKLWTGLANYLYDVFAQPVNDLGELLSDWAKDGREPLIEMFSTIGEKLKDIFDAPKNAFSDVFGKISAKRLVEITKKLRDLVKNTKLFEVASKALYSITKLVLTVFKLLGKVIKVVATAMKPVIGIFVAIIDKLSDYADKISTFINDISNSIKINEAFKKSFGSITDVCDKAIKTISSFGSGLVDAFNVGNKNDGIIGGFANSITFIIKQFKELIELTLEYIETLTGIDMSEFKKTVVGSIENAIETWEKFCSNVKNWYTEAEGGFSGLANVIYNVLAQVFQKIVDKIEELTGWDLSGFVDAISKSLDKAKEKVKSFTDKFNQLYEVNEKLSVTETILTSISDIFKVAIGTIASAFKQLGSAIASSPLLVAFAIFNYKDLHSFTVSLTEFLKTITDAKKSGLGFKDFGKNIKDGFNSLKDGLNGLRDSVNTTEIVSFSIAIGLLAFAMISLSSVDSSKIAAIMGVLTGAFAELLGAAYLANKIPSITLINTLGRVAKAMLVMSVSVLILAKAMKDLSSCNIDQLVNGFLAITGSFLLLIVALEALNIVLNNISKEQMNKILKAGTIMVVLAFSIGILADSIIKLSQIEDPLKMAEGLGVILIAMLGLCAAIEEMSSNEAVFLRTSIALLAISESIKILTDAINAIQQIKGLDLFKSIIALGVAMKLLMVTLESMGEISAPALKTIIALMALSVAVKIISDSIIELTNAAQHGDQMAVAFLTFAGSLFMLVVVLNLIKPQLLEAGAGLLLVSFALEKVSNCLIKLKELSFNQMINGVFGLGVALGAMVVALNMMQGSVGGAAALLVCSIALIALSKALNEMSQINTTDLISSLILLAPALLLLCAACYGFESAIIGAAAILIVGVALLALSEGLKILSNDVDPKEVAKNLGLIAAALAGFVVVALSFTALSSGLLAGSAVIAGVVAIISAGLAILVGSVYLFGIAASAASLGIAGLGESFKIIVDVFGNNDKALTNFVAVIAALVLPLGGFAAVALLAGPAAMLLGVGLLTLGIGLAFLVGAAKLISMFAGSLDSLTESFIIFVTSISDMSKECIKTSGDLLALGLALTALSITAPLAVVGIGLLGPALLLVSAGLNKINSNINKVAEGFKTIGDSIQYLASNGATASTAIGLFAAAMLVAGPSIKDSSKDIIPLVEYMEKLNQACKDLSVSFVNLQTTAITSMLLIMAQLQGMLEDGLDAEPVITPVIDMTKFDEGMAKMDRLITETTKKINNMANAAVDTKGSVLTVKVDNSDVVKSIQVLQKDVINLGNKVNGLKVYMNTNALVGQIAPAMDRQLGISSLRNSRYLGKASTITRKY